MKKQKTKTKYMFELGSTSIENWFDLDNKWVLKNFRTREPVFNKRGFKNNIEV